MEISDTIVCVGLQTTGCTTQVGAAEESFRRLEFEFGLENRFFVSHPARSGAIVDQKDGDRACAVRDSVRGESMQGLPTADNLEPSTIGKIHIHARVGFPEGPQLSDPRNPAYQEWVDLSMGFWTRIRRRMTAEGRTAMTVTPEFGPPFYAPLAKDSADPLADPWSSNRWMREELARQWQIGEIG